MKKPESDGEYEMKAREPRPATAWPPFANFLYSPGLAGSTSTTIVGRRVRPFTILIGLATRLQSSTVSPLLRRTGYPRILAAFAAVISEHATTAPEGPPASTAGAIASAARLAASAGIGDRRIHELIGATDTRY